MVKSKGREVGVAEGQRLSLGLNAPAAQFHAGAGAYSIFTRIFTFPSYNVWRNELSGRPRR
jgi:hypothetical protein